MAFPHQTRTTVSKPPFTDPRIKELAWKGATKSNPPPSLISSSPQRRFVFARSEVVISPLLAALRCELQYALGVFVLRHGHRSWNWSQR